jgi:1-acyl-sn-glycerol-3-phosphate acyltransferase
VGTLFIDRGSRRQIHQVNETVRAALARGDVVALFPEGGIGNGVEMQPFHGSLLQPVIEHGGHVQPVAIRYCDAEGTPTTVAAYVDELSFLASVWRIAGERALRVELTMAPALAGNNRHRRELARTAERIIRAALGAPDASSAPDTRVDRRAGGQ